MKSWKIGALAGLIAGIVAGIAMVFIANIAFKVGITFWNLEPPPTTSILNITIIEIANNIIWGIFLGIIYSRIQDLIPGKGVIKGLIFGLAYYAILSLRNATFMRAYWYIPLAIGALLHLHPIIYGLVIGILYKAPTQKVKISKAKITSGIIPGVIAGSIFAITVPIYYWLNTLLGLMEPTFPNQLADIELLLFQFGAHIVVNMFWFGIIGALYAMSYDRIPGKGLLKGFYFGLIIFLITSFRLGIYWLMYGSLQWAITWGLYLPFSFIIYGVMLDGIYRMRDLKRAILITIGLFIMILIQPFIAGIVFG